MPARGISRKAQGVSFALPETFVNYFHSEVKMDGKLEIANQSVTSELHLERNVAAVEVPQPSERPPCLVLLQIEMPGDQVGGNVQGSWEPPKPKQKAGLKTLVEKKKSGWRTNKSPRHIVVLSKYPVVHHLRKLIFDAKALQIANILKGHFSFALHIQWGQTQTSNRSCWGLDHEAGLVRFLLKNKQVDVDLPNVSFLEDKVLPYKVNLWIWKTKWIHITSTT